jgi:hypothetical protein
MNDAWICPTCDTGWNSERAAEACCVDDDRAGYEPSRGRVSYVLGYD